MIYVWISCVDNNLIWSLLYMSALLVGLEMVVLEIPIPIESEDDILHLYSQVLEQHNDIKLAVIDHITSSSAILMPLKKLAALCHMKGIMVLADGAHAPGQIPLNLNDLAVDFYCGMLILGSNMLFLSSKTNQYISVIIYMYTYMYTYCSVHVVDKIG